MSSKAYSAMVREGRGEIVRVETELVRGLPYFVMVGLASKDVSEARERVKVAIQNSGLEFPRFRKVVNLSPSNVRKHGSQFDLAIALGILNASKQVVARDWLESSVFIGELALDGSIRGVRGTLAMVEEAKRMGFKTVFVGAERVAEAKLVSGIRIFAPKNLRDLVMHLKGEKNLGEADCIGLKAVNNMSGRMIHGHTLVKRALKIAALFRHHIVLVGPPGMGKSVLARSVGAMMPPLDGPEMAEVVRVYSSFTDEDFSEGVVSRPFREVSNTISLGSFVGEMSLAHKGVLMVDDLHSFSRPHIEALLKPMEEREVMVSAGKGKVCLPADFMMVATMNPCPCGYRSIYNEGKCKCREFEIKRFTARLPRAFWDRIDMVVEVPEIREDLIDEEVAKVDFKRVHRSLTDTEISGDALKKACNISKSASDLLARAISKGMISGRGYFNTIKVARSVADLEGSARVEAEHLAEALGYRRIFEG